MSLLYEHQFAGGTAIRFIDKPFQAAQKEVLTVEIDGISQNGRIGTFFAFLFDNDTKTDLAKELYIVLHERYNLTKLVRDKICKTCRLSVCASCRKIAHAEMLSKAREKKAKLVEIGQYRKTGKYAKKKAAAPTQMAMN